MSGYFTQFEKQVAEFRHDLFRTDAEVNGDESGDRCMIRSRTAVKKPHKVDIASAGRLDLT